MYRGRPKCGAAIRKTQHTSLRALVGQCVWRLSLTRRTCFPRAVRSRERQRRSPRFRRGLNSFSSIVTKMRRCKCVARRRNAFQVPTSPVQRHNPHADRFAGIAAKSKLSARLFLRQQRPSTTFMTRSVSTVSIQQVDSGSKRHLRGLLAVDCTTKAGLRCCGNLPLNAFQRDIIGWPFCLMVKTLLSLHHFYIFKPISAPRYNILNNLNTNTHHRNYLQQQSQYAVHHRLHRPVCMHRLRTSTVSSCPSQAL